MSNKYNAVNTQTIKPYIDKSIDSKLSQVINTRLISKNEKIAIFFNDTTGKSDSISGTNDGAKNVFTQSITPSLDNTSPPGLWTVLVDPTQYSSTDYAVLIYKGPNSNVNVETVFTANTNSNTFDVFTQLYLNGAAVDADYVGGRGYYRSVSIDIFGTGNGATAHATVTNGHITAIKAINRGIKYIVPPEVVIQGSGIEAKASVSINGAQGIDTFTLTATKSCPGGLNGIFPTAQNKPNGISRRYNLNITEGDRLELRVNTSTTATTAECKIYQAKLEVLRPILIYK